MLLRRAAYTQRGGTTGAPCATSSEPWRRRIIRARDAGGVEARSTDFRKRWAVSNIGPGEQPQEAVDRLQVEVAALRRSRRRLAEAADADRRAIERDLHDGVQQHLVALAVDLQRLAGLIDVDPGRREGAAGRAGGQRPGGDGRGDGAGAARSIRRCSRRAASPAPSGPRRSGAGVTVVVDVRRGRRLSARRSSPPSTGPASRRCRPRHAGSEATVTRRSTTDGGLTFDISIAGHLADDRLDRLRDRVEALDGRLSVDDRPDGGSRVHGWLPLSR